MPSHRLLVGYLPSALGGYLPSALLWIWRIAVSFDSEKLLIQGDPCWRVLQALLIRNSSFCVN